MTETMSNEQIISAAKSDIDNHIANGTFVGDQSITDDDQENFYTIESLYTQWSEDEAEASVELWKMFEEDYPEHWIENPII